MKKPAYSAALDRVLFRASRLARELGGAQTGTEHLLLALAQEKISSAGKMRPGLRISRSTIFVSVAVSFTASPSARSSRRSGS